MANLKLARASFEMPGRARASSRSLIPWSLGTLVGIALVPASFDARAEQTSIRAVAMRRVTLDEAVTAALANHPSLRSASAHEDAATARLEEARVGALPQAGLSAQLNRSTGNTVP
jgi:outer membrane protein TolC